MSENAIQTTSAFNSSEGFELLQRVGNMFAKSELVPGHLRGKPADCIIAVQLAYEMGLAPLSVLQNIYMVSGKAGWSAQFLIARANASGVFDDSGIDWEVTGRGGDLEVTAFATKRAGGRRVEYTVSYAMAKAEGWTKNAKYQTMPELMLRYRSATTLIGLYCPEVKFGLGVREEFEDISASAPPTAAVTRDERIARRLGIATPPPEADVVDEPAEEQLPPVSAMAQETIEGVTAELRKGTMTKAAALDFLANVGVSGKEADRIVEGALAGTAWNEA